MPKRKTLPFADDEWFAARQIRLAKKRKDGKKWYVDNREKVYIANRKWRKKYMQMLKDDVIRGYGGKCVCCGESERTFLTIDHINGNGQADRKKHRMVFGQLYGWLRDNSYPTDNYRLLCMNCNWGTRYGKCPHELVVKLAVLA